jgi:bla regulator protein blaR1
LTFVALLRLVGLRARAEILLDPVWLSALARAQRRVGFKKGTALLWSDELGSPISWGLIRPIILLSDTAVAASDQAEAIIAHELAHVVHLDWAKLILARVATAAFWFNPLAWVLAREAHQLREEAADDAVLAADIAAPDYAELLIGIARHQCRGSFLDAHGVAPSKSSLGRRVRRVLDQGLARRPSRRSWMAGVAMGMLAMAVPLAAITIVPSHTGLAAGKDSSEVVPLDRPRAPHPSRPTPVAGKANTASRRFDSESAASVDNPEDGITLVGSRFRDVYGREMAEAGFPNLSLGQLNQARALDLTPAYAHAMRATGMELSFDLLVQARASGLNPSYVAAMRGFGVNGTLNDYQALRAVGVTVDFVQTLRRRGITVTAPDELARMRVNGDPNP